VDADLHYIFSTQSLPEEFVNGLKLGFVNYLFLPRFLADIEVVAVRANTALR
jgi:hypothetical protein